MPISVRNVQRGRRVPGLSGGGVATRGGSGGSGG